MRSIEQKNPVTGRSVAPYSFVPPPERVLEWEDPPALDQFHEGRWHGSLELEITAETRVYTRCAYPLEFEDFDVRTTPERQHFYHWEDEAVPILPGSGLRGCIRNLVEILSYSRLSRRDRARVHNSKLMYRSVADRRTSVGKAYTARFLGRSGKSIDFPNEAVRAGYLEKNGDGGWCIRPAMQHQGQSFIRVRDRDVTGARKDNSCRSGVWVKPAPRQRRPKGPFELNYAVTNLFSEKPAAGLEPGVLVISGPMATKRMHTVVYEKDPQAEPLPISRDRWELYEEDRELKRGIPNRTLQNPGDAVFYLVDGAGRLEFFGPNLFFRLPYDLSPADLVIDDFDPARLDFAESVFGTVTPSPRRGRVIFSDGEPLPGQRDLVSSSPVFPEILSTPKPTSYQNYLVQTDDSKDRLKSYLEGDRDGTTLRGFKRYWHREREESRAELHEDDKRDQYTAIRPVRAGAKFASTVHFENLSSEELGGLLTAIDLPASCRHHFGMGKPRGFGSVRIALVRVNLIDPATRYRGFEDGCRSDSEEILRRAREAFVRRIVRHASPNDPGRDLWSISRLHELRCLLDWDSKPSPQETRYLSPNRGGDKAILRDRDVLPAPSQVARSDSPRPTPPPDRSPPKRSDAGGPANVQDARRLLGRPRLEGVVTKVRGNDRLITVEGVVVSLLDKTLKKRRVSREDLPVGTRVALRVLDERRAGHYLAEFIEILQAGFRD